MGHALDRRTDVQPLDVSIVVHWVALPLACLRSSSRRYILFSMDFVRTRLGTATRPDEARVPPPSTSTRTVTRLLLRDERVEGFYAICSAQVRLSQRDRKELTSVHHHTLHPIQPAALVAWIAKRHDAEISGRKLVAHAVFVASQVAELQGTIALVLDPHDGEVSRVWRERYGFRPAVAEEGKRTRRLWLPLHGLTD